MGYERHHAIVVTAQYDVDFDAPVREHWIDKAYRAAVSIFDGTCACVTEPTAPGMNNVRSFLIAPDGSKEGWEDSDAGDEARARYIEWLKEQVYEDNSSPLAWVEVQYHDDDGVTKIVRHSDEKASRV